MKMTTCPKCNGYDKKCSLCHGRGTVTLRQKALYLRKIGRTEICPGCLGDGVINDYVEKMFVECELCHRTGRVSPRRSVRTVKEFNKMSRISIPNSFWEEDELYAYSCCGD